MMKAKKFRRRADDDDADTDDGEKVLVKPVAEKAAKDKLKPKNLPKSTGIQLLSFAEDDEYSGGGEIRSTSLSGKSSSKKEQAKSKTGLKPFGGGLLSFDNDEKSANGSAPQRSKKKSAGQYVGLGHGSGHRLGLGREKSASNPSLSNVQPQAGEYTKEKLAELQRNTIRLGGPTPPVDNKPLEPVVVLKGLVKPPGNGNGDQTVGTDNRDILGEASILDVRDRVERGRERDERDRLTRDKDDAESRLGLMGIGAGAESGGITHIPDAAAIAAAKAKRERLRQAQSAPDYISLATGDGSDLRSKLRESALVREQDDDIEREEDESSADEGEIQGRLAFMGDKVTGPKKRTGVFDSTDERVVEGRPSLEQRDEDEEDEERRWEEEQLRKGFGRRVEETPNRTISAAGASQGPSSGFVTTVQPAPSSGGAGWGFGRTLEGLSISQQSEAAMRTLRESAQRLQEGHARMQSELYRAQESLSMSVDTVNSLEKSLAAAGEKYIYMQELRDYIGVLCDFLQDKAPLIEELEEHMQRLHEERANAMTERRVGDNADEMVEVEAAVGAAKAVLGKGGGTASAAAAASVAAALSVREGPNLAPQLDEFGRDVNLQKRMESKRRAQVRERRLARATAKRATAVNGDGFGSQRVEGESSSEESESEETAYQGRRKEVLDTAARVFGDAAEEFAHLSKVKERLEGWKSQFSSAYRDAYVSLSAPAIFAPYVRLELLQWDPLYGDAGFSNMQWYRQLYEYGMLSNGNEVDPNDTDADLVPKLVEKVALPVLHHEVAHCWDRLSTKGTRRAVAAVMDILIYVPASSDPLQELLGVIRSRMAEAVSSMEVPTWSLQVMTAVPQAARLAAQKFGTSIRLLRNIGMWKDVLALPVLEQLALDELLSNKILPHLRTLTTTLHDAVARTERVMSALSGVWVGPNQESSPKLASFVEYVRTITRAVEKKKDGGASVDDAVGLARRVKRMLVELNEYDRARELAKYFQLREAL